MAPAEPVEGQSVECQESVQEIAPRRAQGAESVRKALSIRSQSPAKTPAQQLRDHPENSHAAPGEQRAPQDAHVEGWLRPIRLQANERQHQQQEKRHAGRYPPLGSRGVPQFYAENASEVKPGFRRATGGAGRRTVYSTTASRPFR